MKTLSTLLAISIAFLLSCCSHSRSKQSPQGVKISTENNNSQIINSVKDYLKLGTELMHQEKLDQLSLGLSAEGLSQILGNPSEESTPTLWGADGLTHKTIKYSKEGVELDLVQKADSSYSVNMITITAPCKFKTLKGIGIDSDAQSIKSAYSDYIDIKELSESQIVAGSIYGGIVFRLENQKVKSIFIGASAE
jgi:hypothetical protein